MRVMAAVDAAYRSLLMGGWVAVDMRGLRETRAAAEARA